MFKLFALAAFFAIAAARPGYLGGSHLTYTSPLATTIVQPSLTHAGHYVQPIVSPVVKTVATPFVHTYGAAPLVSSAYASYGAAPVLKTYGAYAPTYVGAYSGNYGW
ncbi:RNA-binding protein 14-like [Musca vetustissima]|uniref:RNA-binding protein 14-like n=1 Tax=Musca vetustissima TaxID=27455 RepID=UPI002AB7A800|nr:RNA-binding protein 14-like [Musca vetustissima]